MRQLKRVLLEGVSVFVRKLLESKRLSVLGANWPLAETLKRAGVLYFRIYDLRSAYVARRSAGGVADEWVDKPPRR
jgi:hypothetical protein